MREWLPKLVDVERSVLIVLPDGERVRATLDAQHEQGLTRDHVTAAVHYLRFDLTDDQVAAFAVGPVELEIDHPAYLEQVELSPTTHRELLADLRADHESTGVAPDQVE